MIRNVRRLISLAVCLALVLSGTVLAQEAEKKVITIARASDAMIENLDTNRYTLMLEEMFNVDFDFVEYAGNDAKAKFAVVATSKTELPDVVNIAFNHTEASLYGSRGVFLPMNQYFENPEMTKNLDTRLTQEEKEFMLNSWRSTDGNIYGLPTWEEDPWNLASNRYFINQDWLDALDLEVPKTTDELREVLERFVTEDPNGNGINDELGIVGCNGTYGRHPVPFLLNAFTDANSFYNYFAIRNGEVVPAFMEESFRDGLEYINGLVNDGLLYAPSFTQDKTQQNSIVNNEDAYIAGIVSTGSASTWSGGESSEVFMRQTLMEPLVGPDGVSYTSNQTTTFASNWFVTTAADDPELCFAIGEANYALEMQLNNRYGEQDVNWSIAPEVLAKSESVYASLGYEPIFCEIHAVWGEMQNLHWSAVAPFIVNSSFILGSAKPIPEDKAEGFIPVRAVHYNLYMPHCMEEVLGAPAMTDEENKAIADIKTSIDSYVSENIIAFITGNRDFSEWDAYVAEIERMGIETYVEILQEAYDRAH